MNNSEIKDLLSKKDEELAEKKRFTLEIFDLIKDDCVNLMIEKQIECNFKDSQHLYSSEILGFIVKRKGYTFSKYTYEINSIHGVESAWVGCSLRNCLSYRCSDDSDFYKKLDAALLCTKLRKYLISRGFKAYSYVNRFTDERCNGLIFSTTRSKLLNKDKQEVKDVSELAVGVLGILLLIGMIVYGIVKFNY